MYRQLVIFLLFYLSGAFISTAVAYGDREADNKLFFFLAEETVEGWQSDQELLDNFPEFERTNLPVSTARYRLLSDSFANGLFLCGHQLLQSDRVIQQSLFLLFHALLFYELN